MDNEIKQEQPKESLKHKAVKAVFWQILGSGGNQLLQLIISIFLARLIAPEQFGVIAMFGIFTAVAQTFIDSGFTTALIRKQDRTHLDCCTVFYFNVFISIVAYIVLFFCAPFVADFFAMPELCAVMRVSTIGLIIGAFGAVQGSLFSAHMDFKTTSKLGVISVFLSGVIGVLMAFKGFEVWALVAQMLSKTTINVLLIWYVSKWRPTLEFSWTVFREFFGFGSKLLASGLLNTIFGNLNSLVIGKLYKAADLAFVNRGSSLMSMASSTPTFVLQSVTFPTLSQIQDDYDRLRNGYLRTIRICCFVVFPMCLGVGAISYPLINVLYTSKWIFSATLLQVMAFSSMWMPLHAINLNLLIVKGRSDLFFKLEVAKKVISVIALVASAPFGVFAMICAGVASSFICVIINSYYSGPLLNLGFKVQMKALSGIIALSVVMFAIVKAVTLILGDNIVSLVIGVLLGITVYVGGALLFRFPEITELKNLRK